MSKQQTQFFILFLAFGVALLPFQNCGESFELSEELHLESSIDKSEQHFMEGHDPIIETQKVETRYETLLVDRHYLQALFNDIFGPSTQSAMTVKIFDNAAEFGSACAPYQTYTQHNPVTGKRTAAADSVVCRRTLNEFLTAPVNPKGTVTRQSLITRTCSDLTTNNTTLNYALKRISSEAIPAASNENVLKLFNLFYRDKGDPSQGLLDSLLVMLPPSDVTKEHWRLVIYTVCISNYWQVL